MAVPSHILSVLFASVRREKLIGRGERAAHTRAPDGTSQQFILFSSIIHSQMRVGVQHSVGMNRVIHHCQITESTVVSWSCTHSPPSGHSTNECARVCKQVRVSKYLHMQKWLFLFFFSISSSEFVKTWLINNQVMLKMAVDMLFVSVFGLFVFFKASVTIDNSDFVSDTRKSIRNRSLSGWTLYSCHVQI